MYVVDTIEMAEAPLAVWSWIGRDTAPLRSLAMRMAESGPVHQLLAFSLPRAEIDRPVRFDCEVRPETGALGAMFVRWDAHYSRLEGELEVVPDGTGRCRLRLSASYEAPWAAALSNRRTLQRMADEAARAFLSTVAARAALYISAATAAQEPVAAPTRRRVLIEDEDPAWFDLMVKLSDATECEFASCGGPFLVEGGCPVLRGESCSKVEWADTILNSLDSREPANAALLESLKRNHPDVAFTVLNGKPATYCFTRRRKLQPC